MLGSSPSITTQILDQGEIAHNWSNVGNFSNKTVMCLIGKDLGGTFLVFMFSKIGLSGTNSGVLFIFSGALLNNYTLQEIKLFIYFLQINISILHI